MKEIHEKWQDPTEETADMKRLRYEIVLTCRMYQETYGLGDDCLVACLKNATDQIGCSATENELRNNVSMRLSLIENGLKEAVKQIGSMRTDLQSKKGFKAMAASAVPPVPPVADDGGKPKDTFEAAVDRLMAEGMNRKTAMAKVAHEHPDLHKDYIARANQRAE